MTAPVADISIPQFPKPGWRGRFIPLLPVIAAVLLSHILWFAGGRRAADILIWTSMWMPHVYALIVILDVLRPRAAFARETVRARWIAMPILGCAILAFLYAPTERPFLYYSEPLAILDFGVFVGALDAMRSYRRRRPGGGKEGRSMAWPLCRIAIAQGLQLFLVFLAAGAAQSFIASGAKEILPMNLQVGIYNMIALTFCLAYAASYCVSIRFSRGPAR